EETLESGKAYEKFAEIVMAQGGPEPAKVPVGKFHAELLSRDDGYVSAVDNKVLIQLARLTGAPKDKGSGLILHKKRGDKVEAGESFITLYAQSEYKLKEALALAHHRAPVRIEGMLLQRIPEYREVRIEQE
ncbi:MAG: AMP phosphorylase, partial [Methanobacteriota archaeon]